MGIGRFLEILTRVLYIEGPFKTKFKVANCARARHGFNTLFNFDGSFFFLVIVKKD